MPWTLDQPGDLVPRLRRAGAADALQSGAAGVRGPRAGRQRALLVHRRAALWRPCRAYIRAGARPAAASAPRRRRRRRSSAATAGRRICRCVAQAALALVAMDVVQYWLHRAFHGRALWPFHAVHHSAEDARLDHDLPDPSGQLRRLQRRRAGAGAGCSASRRLPSLIIGAVQPGVRRAGARQPELDLRPAALRDRQPGVPPLAPRERTRPSTTATSRRPSRCSI